MPEQPNLGPARALRAYLPKLQGYDDAAITQIVREVSQSGDPARIARLTADVRRYIPRYGQMDEEATARDLVRRRLRTAARLARDTAIRQLTGLLARKGYSSSVAFRVVREELERAGHDASDVVESYD